MVSIYVIGAGVTGLSFAASLGHAKVLEGSSRLGGKAASYGIDTPVGKFTFDVGGHWFHYQNVPEVLQLLEGLPLQRHTRQAFVYLEGKWFDFPLQQSYKKHEDRRFVNQINRELIAIKEKEADRGGRFQNYLDMLLRSYGPTLFEYFFRDYNRKMFGVSDLAQIQVSQYEQIRNVRTDKNTAGYNSYFYYPQSPLGAQAIPEHLANHACIQFNSQVQSIHLHNRTITINDQTVPWDTVISTMPLPKLISMLDGADSQIASLSRHLQASRGFILNLGVKKNPLHANKSWIYVSEMKYCCYRIGFYSNVQSSMAPEGYSSIYVECSPLFFKDEQEALSLRPRVIKDLISIGIIEDERDIVTMKPIYLEHNYCLPDDRITSRLRGYLQQHNIYSIGRYGSWHWSSQHEDMKQAIDLAKELKLTKRSFKAVSN
ncbi:NAD(P)/FAD-dependent oxidoreductase [Paenibacillus vulneris]|uniref:Protoporphyrinogen/coproporphyrinogen oxidase n=1 Tax=Paenibacillus vulneris TaxID=1133364 RepID=A0ABW3UYM1_9BACL